MHPLNVLWVIDHVCYDGALHGGGWNFSAMTGRLASRRRGDGWVTGYRSASIRGSGGRSRGTRHSVCCRFQAQQTHRLSIAHTSQTPNVGE